MSYASQQQGLTGPKLVALIIALSIVGLVGTGMIIFLAVDAVKEVVERVTTVNVDEPPPPPPPPPDEPPPPEQQPETTSPPPPVTPPQQLNLAPNPPPVETRQDIPPPARTETRPSTQPSAPPGPPPAAPKGPSKARGVQPKNQKSWSASIQEDYPRRAAQEEIEGTVGVRCTITVDGRATGCSVIGSSGSAILDGAATKAVERYARFEPALNADGVPISASWSTRIVYKLN